MITGAMHGPEPYVPYMGLENDKKEKKGKPQ
jgi:hypothetical protein